MVAIDCEMVGTGPKGHVSSLARCSIVNYSGDVLYDEYILPPCHIVDYRTRWSGIRKQHVVNATPFKVARDSISKKKLCGPFPCHRLCFWLRVCI
uniref:Exonuclease domain-containing protein n=1 Tax=Piliocolobus tephrosceles TaxID=591936 RepID=A0A8C9HDI5_9PRIM